MLKIVGSARFRPLRNVWMLEELGIKYVHDPARPRSDAARAVNPFGKVPTLVDGDVVLYESAAINTYLGDKFRVAGHMPVLVPEAGNPWQRIMQRFPQGSSTGVLHRSH